MAERTVDKTEDGRYIVVNGRKWRATDPAIPEPLRQQLVSALMTGRRLVKTEGDAARVMVHDAKVALGERGDPWWEPTDTGRRERLAAAMRTLLRERGDTTICPSDAARVVGADDWRDLMPLARQVAVELRDAGVLAVTQKGEEVAGEEFRGPIRLAARDGLKFQPHRES